MLCQVGEHIGDALENVVVARTIMRHVLETASTTDTLSATRICDAVSKRARLLKKYNAAGVDSMQLRAQAACLYEVQAFCCSKGWPEGLIKKLFYQLYEVRTGIS